MSVPAQFNNVVSFLRAIADLLNGAFQRSEFQKIIRTVKDCCCGTGGMLTPSKDRFQQVNPQIVYPPYGDEWSKDFDAVTTLHRDLAAPFPLYLLN